MATTGGSIAISSFPSSSYFSSRKAKATSTFPLMVSKLVALRQRITCSAVQESSTPTVAAAETKDTKEVKTEVAKEEEEEEEEEEKESAPTKPKAPAKAPAKPLLQLMEEEVIPSLKAILEAQDDISELELSFQDNRNKVPLLSVEALHHLHIFIFVLAIVHVTFCALTVVFGGAKTRLWKHWEDSIAKDNYDTEQVLKPKLTDVHQRDFIKGHFLGIGKNSVMLGWLHSFFKQFYGSITRSDYMTLRLGFIMKHCRGNPKFNFHKYMIRALEHDDDFKKVVGIRVAYVCLDSFHSFHSSTSCGHLAGACNQPVGS